MGLLAQGEGAQAVKSWRGVAVPQSPSAEKGCALHMACVGDLCALSRGGNGAGEGSEVEWLRELGKVQPGEKEDRGTGECSQVGSHLSLRKAQMGEEETVQGCARGRVRLYCEQFLHGKV